MTSKRDLENMIRHLKDEIVELEAKKLTFEAYGYTIHSLDDDLQLYNDELLSLQAELKTHYKSTT